MIAATNFSNSPSRYELSWSAAVVLATTATTVTLKLFRYPKKVKPAPMETVGPKNVNLVMEIR